MFTGIVQAIGSVERAQDRGRDRELVVRSPEVAPRLSLGDSVAIEGVCQTVTEHDAESFRVHAIAETLRVTTLGALRAGDAVNLEAALGAGDPMGGHFVQGHVDGMARIVGRDAVGESWRLRFEGPAELVGQLVPKGSVCIDGVSLTVGPALSDTRFEVFLIPHTMQVTTLGKKDVGDAVNLETDILGKYLLRYLGQGGGLDLERLRAAGFGGDR